MTFKYGTRKWVSSCEAQKKDKIIESKFCCESWKAKKSNSGGEEIVYLLAKYQNTKNY